ncbi:MAG: nucleotidyltransferase family protein [Colwellia sp.]|nr:nucleotidyltransferase family protein [Colwellia sp.]
MTQVKKAILLSAGFGTRLRPLTNTLPKCLVPINGKPLLQIWLEQLTENGIEEFLINSHYLSEQVREFIENSVFKSHVTIFHEPELLGTLGTLKSTLDFWKDESVLVAHADNLCLCSWSKFQQQFFSKKDDVLGTMMVFNTDTPKSCGIIEYNDSGRVTAFHEKVENPPSNLANAAIYIFDPRVRQLIAQSTLKESDISLHLIPQLLGKLNFWQTDGYCRDIGSMESLAKAEYDISKMNLY